MNGQLKMLRARFMGKGPLVCCPPSPRTCLPTQKFSRQHSVGVFMENSSHQHDWSLTQSLSPLPSPEDGGDGLKVPSFSSWPTTSLLVISLKQKTPVTQEVSRDLKSPCQDPKPDIRTKDDPHALIT